MSSNRVNRPGRETTVCKRPATCIWGSLVLLPAVPSARPVADRLDPGQARFVVVQPQWPWCLKQAHKGPPFFPTDEVLAVFVAAVMGLQHALAMVGGIVTPPLIIGYLQDDPKVANCRWQDIDAAIWHICNRLDICFSICRSCGSLLDCQRDLYLYTRKRLSMHTSQNCKNIIKW